jgi:predicted secreted protein
MADIEFGIGGGTGNISVGVGETVTLRINENPTTGFIWQPVGGDASLERLDFQQEQDAGIGAAGWRSFRLRAEQPGTHRVVLELRRPGVSESARARTELIVEVR